MLSLSPTPIPEWIHGNCPLTKKVAFCKIFTSANRVKKKKKQMFIHSWHLCVTSKGIVIGRGNLPNIFYDVRRQRTISDGKRVDWVFHVCNQREKRSQGDNLLLIKRGYLPMLPNRFFFIVFRVACINSHRKV